MNTIPDVIAAMGLPEGTIFEEVYKAEGHEVVRFMFRNGYGLSVARGYMTYGGAKGLFEALPVDPLGAFLEDQIAGWLTAAEVCSFAAEVAAR